MKRTITLSIASTVLAAGLLAGCGGEDSGSSGSEPESGEQSASSEASPSESTSGSPASEPTGESAGEETASSDEYCNRLQEVYALASPGGSQEQFDELLETFRAVGEAAPPELAEDWEIINSRFEEVAVELEKAGLEPADLAGAGEGQLPEGVTRQELAPVVEAVQGLDGPEVQEAYGRIGEYAETECVSAFPEDTGSGGTGSGGSG